MHPLEQQTIEQESYSDVQKLVCSQPCALCFVYELELQQTIHFIINQPLIIFWMTCFVFGPFEVKTSLVYN